MGSKCSKRVVEQVLDEQEDCDENTCVVCYEPLDDKASLRTSVKLRSCSHQFHLDCIGSEFNAKNKMICPLCRTVEHGRWLFGRGPQNPDSNARNFGYQSHVLPQPHMNGRVATEQALREPPVLPSVWPRLSGIRAPARSTIFSRAHTTQQEIEERIEQALRIRDDANEVHIINHINNTASGYDMVRGSNGGGGAGGCGHGGVFSRWVRSIGI